jgi:ADP-ribose pyrophosphatase
MKLISSEKILETSIFTVTQDHAVDPDGFEIKRAIVQHAGSAVVMPVDDKGRVLLVRQYRLPAKSFMWEIPAGRVDAGENVLQAAKRELKEETGFKAKKWTKVSSFYVSPGFLAEKMTIFLAEDLKEGEQEPMEDERIQLKWFRAKELDDMVESGKIMDAKTIIAFLAWKRYHTGKRAK